MNFFFGVNQGDIQSKISIPKFQNSGKFNRDNLLYSVSIVNSKWFIKKEKTEETESFFKLKANEIDNHKIFFIATDQEVSSYFSNNVGEKLEDLNTFSDTAPSFRCNLKVFKKNNGYSSYQSEDPYVMTKKRGNILSSLYLLTNKNAENNYVLFRNIFHMPTNEEFKIYIVDVENQKVLFEENLKSNYSNLIKIDKKFINKNFYIFTSDYLGIPIYLSEKNGHLSFEHTHPPHTYILNKNKYEVVGKLKKKINEIINK